MTNYKGNDFFVNGCAACKSKEISIDILDAFLGPN
ncbi:hypothetical protein M2447_002590 [Ereboglobus sp. PH5-10]|nr:hypothetical protein [Ereboglobus sp. PH5-10]